MPVFLLAPVWSRAAVMARYASHKYARAGRCMRPLMRALGGVGRADGAQPVTADALR